MYGHASIQIGHQLQITRRANDFYGIYNTLEPIVGHEEAEDASSWCEIASIGEEWSSRVADVQIVLTD